MKNNRHLFLVQTISAVGFGISYLLLGAYEGFLINVISFSNTFILLNKKWRKQIIKYVICLCYVSVPIIVAILYNGPWTTDVIVKTAFSCLIGVMQTPYTLATWKDDGKIIRTVRLFALTPAWLSYNIAVFNTGGIICECFNIISIIVSFIRHGKNGFTK
jgi:hypothetical protein